MLHFLLACFAPGGGRSPIRPWRNINARSRRPSTVSRSWVTTSTMRPSVLSNESRCMRAATADSSSPVNGSSSKTSRGVCSSARSSASRCLIPRENPSTTSSARSLSAAVSSAASTLASTLSSPYIPAKNARFSRAVSSG